ncbi:MAG: CHAT domain-containing protein [Saprospiraceae bacterium]
MINYKKIKGILILLSISLFVFGQCPNEIDVKTILGNNEIDEISQLINKLKECPNHKKMLGDSYHKLGALYYNYYADYELAITSTKKALQIRKELFSNNPNIDLGKSFRNLGIFNRYIGKYKLSQESLEEAISILSSLDFEDILYVYLELARTHLDQGEFKLAEDFLDLITVKAKELDDEFILAQVHLTRGNIFNEIKQTDKAIISYKSAIKILEEFEIQEDEASCYANLGNTYFQQRDYSQAIIHYQKALEIFNLFENDSEVAKMHNQIGLNRQKLNQSKQSFQALQKGLSIATSVNSKEIIAQSHDNLGEHYLAKKDYKKALSHFQKAIQTLLPGFHRKQDWHNPTKMDVELAFNKIDLLIYLRDKAKTLRLLSDSENDPKYLTSALQVFELGDVVIDQLRKEHQDQDTKLFWRKEAIPFYENAIEICYEMQNVEKAFFFFEKSKAILLLEALQTSDALELIPDSLKNQIQTLQQNLLKTKEELENTNSTVLKRENIIRDLVGQQAEFEFEVKQLEKDYPKFFEVKFGTKVILLNDAQNEFAEEQGKTAIHFFYGEKNIYAITIHLQESKLHQLGSTSSIEKELRSLLSFFEKSSNIENAPIDFLQQSKKVYDALIAPLSIKKGEEVVIFPDGALAYLPFEALVSRGSNDIALANYLIKDHPINYGYSATIFSKLNQSTNQSTENSIAAFAPFADGSVNSKYATLAFSQDELGEISEQIDGVFLKNQKATKQYFLKENKKFSVLHLSTHAFSSATESKPHIVFADTSLFLSELYGIEILADLVVLSACQSNIGKLSPGEGVMSLGRGFTFAGSKSLVSSLWNVNAVSTSTILSDFYKKMQNGNSKYASLHEAKLAYLENENIPSYERSPYYWAGLIYYGDDGGLILKEKKSNNYILLVLLGLVCLAFGFYFSKRNKKI